LVVNNNKMVLKFKIVQNLDRIVFSGGLVYLLRWIFGVWRGNVICLLALCRTFEIYVSPLLHEDEMMQEAFELLTTVTVNITVLWNVILPTFFYSGNKVLCSSKFWRLFTKLPCLVPEEAIFTCRRSDMFLNFEII
jgi:hypothetical protein